MRTALSLTASSTVLVAGPAWVVAPAAADETPGATDGAADQRMQLVLDSSGSMAEPARGGGTKIDAARTALDHVVDTLPADATVGMRVYGATVDSGRGACTDSQEVVAPGTDNRDQLRAAVDAYEPLGETPIGYALEQAAVDLGSEGKRTIVLVSDGESTCAPDPCKIARGLAKDGIDMRVDVVGLSVDRRTRKQLRCIADAGNGSYYDADGAADLTKRLEVTSTRAFRPFRFTGTPVDGATEAIDAPTVTGGRYVDTFDPAGEMLHYRIERTQPGTTVYVSATTRSPDGALVASLGLDLSDEEGNRCGSSSRSIKTNLFGARPLVSVSTSSWEEAREQTPSTQETPSDPTATPSATPSADPCADGSVLYASLKRLVASDDLDGEPFELLVSEEPPLVEGAYDDLPPATESVRWTAIEPEEAPSSVVPGDSLSNAPVVEPGSYAGEVLGGETQVFAIPVDWGQQLQAQLDLGPLTERQWDATGIASGISVDVFDPDRTPTISTLRIENEPEWWRDGFTQLFGEEVKTYRTGATTPVVRYRNRAEFSARDGARAGVRYVEVNMSTNVDDGVTIPYTLTLQTYGTAGDGAPEYAEVDGLDTSTGVGAPPTTGAGGTSDDGADSGSDGDAAAASDGSTVPSWLVVALGVVVALLLAAVVAVVVLARRASRS
ncbi:UNVERIFIED_CONTAM: hypothetical protein LK11_49745 [Mumia flava]